MDCLPKQGGASESILRAVNRYYYRLDYILYRHAGCLLSHHTTGYKKKVQARKERERLIKELNLSVEQNNTLIASRKKAVHTITHELRTPLTAITGYTELLQKNVIAVIMDIFFKAYSNPPGVCGICSTPYLTSSVWTMARSNLKCTLAEFQ